MAFACANEFARPSFASAPLRSSEFIRGRHLTRGAGLERLGFRMGVNSQLPGLASFRFFQPELLDEYVRR